MKDVKEELKLLSNNIKNLSKITEVHTNSLYEIRFIIKELKLVDDFTNERIKLAINNLEKLNEFNDKIREKKDNENNKTKWWIFTIISTIISTIILGIIKKVLDG